MSTLPSQPCNEVAREVLDECLAGRRVSDAQLRRLPDAECGATAFTVVAEGLADRFEPRLVACYVDLFTRLIAWVRPGVAAADLAARYARISRPRPLTGTPAGAVVLSRVTVGADVAITSVLLDALKRCLPHAELVLVGGPRLRALYGADPRIRHQEFTYPRAGSVGDRVEASYALRDLVPGPDWIVVDPDSRLTQLGLVPICGEAAYYYFPSRIAGGASDRSLGTLAREWAAATFGVAGARAYVAPPCRFEARAQLAVCVSFGVGGNDGKRVGPDFEIALVRGLLERGAVVHVDAGATHDERAQVEAIVRTIGNVERVRVHEGDIGSLAVLIGSSCLYVGYDSSGQHIAAAAAVPLVTVFRGYPSPRFLARWRPFASGVQQLVDAQGLASAQVLTRTLEAIDALGVLPAPGALQPV